MAEQGSLTSVQGEYAGTEVTADLAIGTTVLPVLDATAVAVGDTVWIDEVTYEVTATDGDLSTVTVTPGLVAAVEETEAIAPDTGGEPFKVWTASVSVVDGQEPIEVVLTAKDLLILPEGVYDPPVDVTLSDDHAELLDVPGRRPVVDGTLIDEDTLPMPDIGPTDPPIDSPGVQVIGFAEGLIVQAEPVDQSTLIEYHVSTDPAFVPVPGDVATMAFPERTRDQIVVIRQLPGGEAPALNTPYYVRTFAWNELGYADTPGVVDGATLDPEIVSKIVTDELAARQVTAAKVVVGNSYWDSTGLYIATPNGTISFPATGGAAEIIGVALVAFALTVTGDATFEGLVSLRNTATMTAGLSNPGSAPQTANDWPIVTPVLPGGASYSHDPAYWSGFSDSIDGTEWVTFSNEAALFDGVAPVLRMNKVTGAVTIQQLWNADGVTPSTFEATTSGMVRVGDGYYKIIVAGGTWRIAKWDSTFKLTGSFPITMPSGASFSYLRLGRSDTNLIVSSIHSSNSNILIREFSPSTGLPVAGSDFVIANADAANTPYPVWKSSFDIGATRYLLAQEATSPVRVFSVPGSGTVLVRQTTEEWVMPSSTSSLFPGLWWDGWNTTPPAAASRRFWTMMSTGKVYQHSRHRPGLSMAAALTYDYTDGVNQTGLSPSKAHTRTGRTFVRVTLPKPPTTPPGLSARLYDQVKRQSTALVDQGTNLVGYYDGFNNAGAANPGNTFTSGNLGKLAATNKNFSIDGNSDGSVGTGTFRDSVRAAGYDNTVAHRCVLSKTTGQTYTSGQVNTDVVVSFQQEETDIGNLGDVANNRIIIQKDGLYSVRAGIQLNGALPVGESMVATIAVNSIAMATDICRGVGQAQNRFNQANPSLVRYLTAGQIVTLEVTISVSIALDAVFQTASNPGTFIDVMEVR